MGMEKFFDIVCRLGNLRPDAVVLVATVKALKHHANDPDGGAKAIEIGGANLARHLSIVREFGLNAVVAVNRFPGDKDDEIELVKRIALEHGAYAAEVNDGFTHGGPGAAALAEAVVAAADEPSGFDYLYPLDAPIDEQDRRNCKTCVRGRRGLPSARRTRKDQGIRKGGPRPPPDLHGEDPPLPLPRPVARQRADRIHRRRP